MNEQRDTEDLLQALRRGDSAAGRALLCNYRDRLLRYATALSSDPKESEDAVQDAFAALLAEREAPAHLRAWLYRCTRNACFRRRAQSRRAESSSPSALDARVLSAALGPSTEADRAEQERLLHAAVGALTAVQQELLRLRYSEDLSRAEIAQVLELPEPLVKSRLYDAISRLRSALSAASDSSRVPPRNTNPHGPTS